MKNANPHVSFVHLFFLALEAYFPYNILYVKKGYRKKGTFFKPRRNYTK